MLSTSCVLATVETLFIVYLSFTVTQQNKVLSPLARTGSSERVSNFSKITQQGMLEPRFKPRSDSLQSPLRLLSGDVLLYFHSTSRCLAPV